MEKINALIHKVIGWGFLAIIAMCTLHSIICFDKEEIFASIVFICLPAAMAFCIRRSIRFFLNGGKYEN